MMHKQRWLFPLGLGPALLIAAGGIAYAITGVMGTLPLTLIWLGLLGLVFFFYVFFTEIRGFITKRSTRYALNTALMSGVFLLIIALIGGMSVKYKLRVDLTADNRYTLSSQTIKILKSLPEDIEAIAFYRSDERTRQAMFDLLSEYAYHSPRFTFRFVDPDRDPSEAVKYGITSYRTTLLKYRDRQDTVGTESENKLTNALIKLIARDTKVFYFAQGHGEKRIGSLEENGYAYLKDAVERENHQVRELLLMNAEKVPDDAAVLVVAGPETDYLPAELDKISGFIRKGGRVLFLLDPGGAPAFVPYLRQFGFELGADLIIDKMSQVYGANFLMPVVVAYFKNHPVTADFDLATFFPIARSVRIKEDPAKGSYELALTSDKSWTTAAKLTKEDEQFSAERHKRGPVSVVAVTAAEVDLATAKPGAGGEDIKTWGKVVVIGDSDFASNKFLKTAGNRDFVLNVLNWLAEEHILISIRKKEPGLTPLMLTQVQGRVVFWLVVVILPSLVLALGLAVAARRRRSA
ncbi:hypothetical protein BURK2_04433 [Burkholderiales bacterium]|nr:MAG: hypothetical protein F9K47_08890 [Burkholderiales bacterium]CAG1012086.1 hypothetical protein BURK2_04433 [Burkholderiales bacterium]